VTLTIRSFFRLRGSTSPRGCPVVYRQTGWKSVEHFQQSRVSHYRQMAETHVELLSDGLHVEQASSADSVGVVTVLTLS